MPSVSSLITVSASGDEWTVGRAIAVAMDLMKAGFPVQVLAFADFESRIVAAGIRFCPAPGDLAGFMSCDTGVVARQRYLANAASGMPMTLDARLRDSAMVVICDESPLLPSFAEARGLTIARVPSVDDFDAGARRGFGGWIESMRTWHAVHAAVNEMRMFLGLPDFTSPHAFRRSNSQVPILDIAGLVALRSSAPARRSEAPASTIGQQQTA